MDFLDPKKQQRHRIILLVGYVLIAIAIILGVRLLTDLAAGYAPGKNGTVIQNGLTFFSSQPNPARIYVNGKLAKVQTNTRLVLPGGIYKITLARNGYRDWQRTIELDGGAVEHFDYPFLIPNTLASKKLQTYTAAPGLATQSPDRRWWVVQKPGSMTSFEVYDLRATTKTVASIDLPANLLSKATGSEQWQLVDWADDNRHLLLQHMFDGKSEFILVDRTNPDQSLNLNNTLQTTPTKITLINKKYDRYYLYDAANKTLQTASLSSPKATPVLDHILGYQTYSDDTLLYATDNGAPAGKVLTKLQVGTKTYALKSFPAGTTYLLDLTKYSGTLYMAIGASSENKVYIYKDPIGQLNKGPKPVLVPSQVLHVVAPNYLSFSTNAQFIVTENATQFGVYDIENTKGYNYTSPLPLDAPQVHASWMDGDRLTYVSGGKLVIFDYDNTNRQVLVPAGSAYLPAFAPNFKFVYTLTPAATAGQVDLNQTSLLAPADQ